MSQHRYIPCSKSAFKYALLKAWNGQGGWGKILVFALLPVSWLFAGLVAIRRLFYQYSVYKQEQLPVPVIVVGNVMVGGVGKTPVTIALVKHLSSQGIQVGVLSRGHGRHTQNTLEVTAFSAANQAGDEPLLIARTCKVPVFVGTNRVEAGRSLLSRYPSVQVLVCDDGLQHWSLARDLELCVFDERGIGNGNFLPAGPLREAWPRKVLRTTSSKHEVPCLVLKTAGQAGTNEYAVSRHLADFAVQADGTQRQLSKWKQTPAQALAGIAKPELFFAMLRAKGVALSRTQALPDHDDLQDLNIDFSFGEMFCTEKDAVKLWTHHPSAWAVPLETTLPSELLLVIEKHLATAQIAKLSSPYGH